MALQTVNPTIRELNSLSTYGALAGAPGGRAIYAVDGVPYLFVRVTKSATTWFYQRTVKRRQVRETIGVYPTTTFKAAKSAAEQLSARIAAGEDVVETRRRERETWTFGDAYKDYLAEKKRTGTKSMQTIEGYWDNWLSRYKDRKLEAVSPAMLRDLKRAILKKRSGATCNRIMSTGKAIFNRALRDETSGFEGVNPFNKITPEKEKRRTARVYPGQIPKIGEALNKVSPTMRDFLLLAIYTGRRAGEIRTMRWVDIDFDTAGWLSPDTKADEPQIVALAPQAIDLLKTRRETVGGIWVFPGDGNDSHIAKGGYRKAWKAVQKHAGLEGIRLHDLRRSVASISLEAGTAVESVAKMLGHKDKATTQRIYTNISTEAQRAVAEKSAKAWKELLG